MRLLVMNFVIGGMLFNQACAKEPTALDEAIGSIQKVGSQGEGHAEAIDGWKYVAQQDVEQLPRVLAGMSENVLANNWIRAAVQSIVDNALQSGDDVPIDRLVAFIKKQSNPSRGREVAFQIATQDNAQLREQLIPGMLNDSSLVLRRLAVEKVVESAKHASEDQQKLATLRNAFQHARDVDQIKEIAAEIRELKADVDLARHFGFIRKWQLIAPFDNSNKTGFNKEYPPEGGVQLDDVYEGKNGAQAKWVRHFCDDDYGLVDLNEALGKHKGAVAYAYAEFDSKEARDVELRLGCINGNKVWLNGKLVTANHVYHSGRGIDQYVGQGKLRAGSNEILVKILQNEQSEPWAQESCSKITCSLGFLSTAPRSGNSRGEARRGKEKRTSYLWDKAGPTARFLF